ncbi:DJ-1/PfpI family protein [Rubidibacter lacunae]|uniref:DJ-1/PfpI family protein n=1 Tax=Rubidibacter lacunae TaxID=582514 RepID=UPI0018DE1A2A|nr:DJ-1/PfpI family protein [Rubidibacter lacunae]
MVLIPGGYGTRRAIQDLETVAWVAQQAGTCELLLSVCTGALLLAKAGLLDGKPATTHHGALDMLGRLDPTANLRDRRVIDNGDIVLTASISAGIDMSLHVVARLLGEAAARDTATYMEYDWYGSDVALARSALQAT